LPEKIGPGEIDIPLGLCYFILILDKQDLVNWVFKNEIQNIYDVHEGNHWSKSMLLGYRKMLENKSFYINALNSQGQNCFKSFFCEITFKNIAHYYEEHVEKRENNALLELFCLSRRGNRS
jgi:hypothetical protein